MDAALLESPAAARSLGVGPSFDSMLKESIDRFLVEAQKDSCDFSAFRSILFRFLQSSVDPPLEVIWFYSAVGFHEAVSGKEEAFDRVVAVRDLLHLLSACFASCGSAKSVALLAPAVAELYSCAADEKKLSRKAAKKVRREIESLVEGIVSCISICSGKSWNGGEFADGCLLPCFVDLVRVWTVRHSGSGDGLAVLFPLVSDEIRSRLGRGECGVGYLAGVVVAEAFLLKLCLKVQAEGAKRPELQKELRIWAVSSITFFRNRVFFDVLLRLLLEPTLPVTSFLGYADESLVRDILYDAVILVDYSFINLGRDVERSDDSIISLVMRRLIVTHEAIRIARDKGDYDKAISYSNAFSSSFIPNGLVKWVTNRVSLRRHNRPVASTPQALLKWLMGLEARGLRLFEDSISKLRTKLIFDESDVASEGLVFKSGSKKTDGGLFFFDNQGEGAEDKDMEAMDTAFLTAAHSMRSVAVKGMRKRKECGSDEEGSRVKFIKYKIYDSSVKDISSGSEVENPLSDDDMEESDQ